MCGALAVRNLCLPPPMLLFHYFINIEATIGIIQEWETIFEFNLPLRNRQKKWSRLMLLQMVLKSSKKPKIEMFSSGFLSIAMLSPVPIQDFYA